MTTPSLQPPSQNSGSKYAVVGLLLLLLAGGLIWFATKDSGKDALPEPVEPQAVERLTALEDEELVIPDAEPDAGSPPDAGAPPKRRKPRGPLWDSCRSELPTAEVTKIIKKNRRQVRSCYERRLKVNNMLQGTVRVKLRVLGSGKVSGVRVSGSLSDAEVTSCIRALAAQWVFPSTKDGGCAVIEQPFNLTPRR